NSRILTNAPAFRLDPLKLYTLLRIGFHYRKQHRRQHGKEIVSFHIRMILVNVMPFHQTQI
ncbi:hypothetical protein, partial [uncultured Bacteroides sp.]|uniref:hypothetical protein n=1 Tax=uncultured Bacteroides sp. TaxID=162156 RepID=UPI002595879C